MRTSLRRAVRAAGAALAVGALGIPAVRAEVPAAPVIPDAIYSASATGAGLVAFVDAQAIGGAVYVANLSAPFAESVVTTGPSSSGVASYAYDRNAATGLYYIVSSAIQAEDGPALPEIPNLAEARYPGVPSDAAGTSKEVDTDAGVVGASSADAVAEADHADARARTAYAEIAGAVTAGGQAATSTVRVEAGRVIADSRAVVHDLIVAEVLRIATVVGESHVVNDGTTRTVRTSFRILDATVAGIPVTIGSDGVRAKGSEDPGAAAAVAELNRRVSEALVEQGITVRILDAVTSQEENAFASTPGLEIRMPVPTPPSVPGGTLGLVVGRTDAAGAFSPLPPPTPVFVPPIPPVPPTVVTIIEPGSLPGFGGEVALPQQAYVAVRRSVPALALFALWQLSAFGTVLLAWWRRGMRSAGQ